MSTARIFQRIKSSTSSGKANLQLWMLEFERSEAERPDPLTGWAGSGDTQTQVKLSFGSCEEAVDYAERNGIPVNIVRPAETKLKLQTYADNFR